MPALLSWMNTPLCRSIGIVVAWRQHVWVFVDVVDIIIVSAHIRTYILHIWRLSSSAASPLPMNWHWYCYCYYSLMFSLLFYQFGKFMESVGRLRWEALICLTRFSLPFHGKVLVSQIHRYERIEECGLMLHKCNFTHWFPGQTWQQKQYQHFGFNLFPTEWLRDTNVQYCCAIFHSKLSHSEK